MLTIILPAGEWYDQERNLFIPYKECSLTLEHSLVSISKWESKWHKPFYGNKEKTQEETIDYIRCMVIGQIPDINFYKRFSEKNISEISEYITDPMTATTFSNNNKKASKEILTSEIIYYLMVAYGIPFECQKWHINKLLTLIKVCEIKNEPPKKMSKADIYSRNRALNAARRAKYNTKG